MAPKWQAKDDYFETCNCRTLCPCISLSPPTEGNCTVLEWHIESGKFGYASLDGLNVAADWLRRGISSHLRQLPRCDFSSRRASCQSPSTLTSTLAIGAAPRRPSSALECFTAKTPVDKDP